MTPITAAASKDFLMFHPPDLLGENARRKHSFRQASTSAKGTFARDVTH
jgi:hypothetical protein